MAVVVADADTARLELDALEFIDNAMQLSAKNFPSKPRFTDILLDLKSCEYDNGSTITNSFMQKYDELKLPTVLSVQDENSTKPSVTRHRKNSHVKAEQKRRKRIQSHLWTLTELVPSLSYNKSAKKLSELDVVNETIKIVKDLKSKHEPLVQNIGELKKKSTALMESICVFQANLPAKGIPRSERRIVSLDEMYTQHVNQRVCTDWTYWIFSFFCKPLFETFKEDVVTTTAEQFVTSLNQWTEERLCLTFLRPVVIRGLRDIGVVTTVIDRPDKLKEEAMKSIKQVKSEES